MALFYAASRTAPLKSRPAANIGLREVTRALGDAPLFQAAFRVSPTSGTS